MVGSDCAIHRLKEACRESSAGSDLLERLTKAERMASDAVDALTRDRQGRFEQQECMLNRVLTWIDEENRKSPSLAFTAGPERQIAYRFESLRTQLDAAQCKLREFEGGAGAGGEEK
jgi:hypothetical protein